RQNYLVLFNKWQFSQSSASECQNFPLISVPQNLDAELNLPFSSNRFASGRTWKSRRSGRLPLSDFSENVASPENHIGARPKG
ncbi:hypothetical protein, partial [Rhodovulum sulfidophilum]|uniref:hypothetical protein n=1 Tax=Rhodovulum sulfidophilum TaxID=35806 RepID=UPI001F410EED